MKIKVKKTDFAGLEETLNKIGYWAILKIIPSVEYDTTLYTVIYGVQEEVNIGELTVNVVQERKQVEHPERWWERYCVNKGDKTK